MTALIVGFFGTARIGSAGERSVPALMPRHQGFLIRLERSQHSMPGAGDVTAAAEHQTERVGLRITPATPKAPITIAAASENAQVKQSEPRLSLERRVSRHC